MVSQDRKQTSELDVSHSPRQVILKELFYTLSTCSSLRWDSDIILTIQTWLCISGRKSKWLDQVVKREEAQICHSLRRWTGMLTEQLTAAVAEIRQHHPGLWSSSEGQTGFRFSWLTGKVNAISFRTKCKGYLLITSFLCPHSPLWR